MSPYCYKTYRLVPGLAAMALALLCCLTTLSAQAAPKKPDGPPPLPVKAIKAIEKKVSLTINLVGTAAPNRSSRVAAETGGRVMVVYFKEGDLVRKGDPLIDLDKANEELGLKAAEAMSEGIRIRLEEARQKLARSQKLKTSNTISDQAFESDYFQVKNLESSLEAAKAEAARLSDKIQRMTVRAPFAGYIVEKKTEAGQWVNQGTEVATLVDLSEIKVVGALPERYVTHILKGDSAKVTFDALGSEVFTGQVTAVIPSADENSRNFPVEISLPNPDGLIKAGLLARIELAGREKKLLLVPKDALVLDRGRATIFVVKDETAQPVAVSTGEAYDELIEVSGEISAGDLVVVEGNERLRPQQKVLVNPPSESAAE